jgi:hypothetical protein
LLVVGRLEGSKLIVEGGVDVSEGLDFTGKGLELMI